MNDFINNWKSRIAGMSRPGLFAIIGIKMQDEVVKKDVTKSEDFPWQDFVEFVQEETLKQVDIYIDKYLERKL